MKNHSYVIRLTFTALFAAIIMLSTMISIPVGSGYLNPGDAMIYAAAWFLGPLAGAAAAIGSALADVILGYVAYAPATFLIKGAMGLVVGLLMIRHKGSILKKIIAMSVGSLIMVSGYFAYEFAVMKLGAAAAASILWNLVQAAVGVSVGMLLVGALGKIKGIEGFIDRFKGN